MRKLSIVILSWNGRSHLEVCLPAVLEQKVEAWEWEVLVLDNGSSDGTAEWLETNFPRVRRILSPTNLGFCAGNNRLVDVASGDWIVFLNNDTRPQPGWLAALADSALSAPSDVAAVSGKIIDWQGTRLDFGRGLMTFDGHAFQQDYGCLLSEVQSPSAGTEVLFACGGNMIVRKEVYQELGGFDESYFAYLEDVDLGWRMWSAGHRVLFAPDAIVHHRSMATSQLLGNHHRGFLFERNAYLTAYKNYDDELWGKMMPIVLLTLQHRTQTLLVENNPGGGELTLDPYAGWIADTGRPSSAPPALEIPHTTWSEKWRGYGPREFFRRGAKKAARLMLPRWIFEQPQAEIRLEDPRTIAQLRALSYLGRHLDAAAVSRQAVQERRRRSDRDIFDRFPLYVVPTYPGDQILFDSAAFDSWLPEDVQVIRRQLADIMAI